MSCEQFDEILVCPACRGTLRSDEPASASLVCTHCGAEYPVHEGIPLLVPAELRVERAPAADHARAHKERQVVFFDQDPHDDFGVVRPRGAPALYQLLFLEKFRRSVIGLEDLLPGSTALVICGGSGLDAEFLVRAGARVILSDISLGVVLQARERARRFDLALDLVVADAEALPFRDSSIDVVYVHDGLHHLERPETGLVEMTRVARRAVSVSEPARALVSGLATRVGIAQAVEEAGNPVARLELHDLTRELARRGFRPVEPHRYLMFYRHWPGRLMQLFSHRLLLRPTVALLRIVNRVFGRFGNKLAVQAVRVDEPKVPSSP